MSMFKNSNRSKSTGSKVRLLAGAVMTAAIVLALSLVGCADDDEPGDNNGTTGGGGDTSKVSSGLVLGENEAWVHCYYGGGYGDNGWCEHIIFLANGGVLGVEINNNGEPVGFVHEFTWSVSGNKIILKTYNRCTGKIEEINEGGVPINYTYGISGNTLTLNLKASRRYTVTDVSGIHINENNNINIPAGNRDNRLILPDNRAWVTDYRYCTNDDDTVYTMRENREGHMFRSDGSYVYIYQDERWHGYVEGTWSTNGNELILEREWYDDSSIYTVSGNNLTFEFSMSFSYTKTGGIVLTRIYDSWEDYQRDNTVIYNMSKRPTRDRPLSPMLRRPGLMGSR